MNGKIFTALLTCRISPDARIQSAKQQLQPYSDMVALSIIDGFIDTDPEVPDLHHELNYWWSGGSMTRREVAAYGTHRLAWKRMLDDGYQSGLFLEDDFVISAPAQFGSMLAEYRTSLPDGVDLLKIFNFPLDVKARASLRLEQTSGQIFCLPRPKAGMVGYFLTAEGARKLLSRRKVYRPVDEDIRYYWEFGITVWTTRLPVVTDGSDTMGGSLVVHKHKDVSVKMRLKRLLAKLYRQTGGLLAFLPIIYKFWYRRWLLR